MSTKNELAILDNVEPALTPTQKQAKELRWLHHYAEQNIEAAKLAVFNASRAVVVCGIKLAHVKASLPHGKFTGFINDNCDFSPRTARNYMNLAEEVVKALPANDREEVLKLATIAPKDINGDKLKRIDKALPKGHSGTRALYQHFGILKAPATANLRIGGGGGSTGDPDGDDSAAEAERLLSELEDFVARDRHLDLSKQGRLTMVDTIREAATKIRRAKK